jgi:putative transcriptional regulator
MIRFKLKQMIAEHEFRTGRHVRLDEIAQATDIHRATLSKIINVRGYNTTTANLDRLCAYFGCRLPDLAEYLPDSEAPRIAASSSEGEPQGR